MNVDREQKVQMLTAALAFPEAPCGSTTYFETYTARDDCDEGNQTDTIACVHRDIATHRKHHEYLISYDPYGAAYMTNASPVRQSIFVHRFIEQDSGIVAKVTVKRDSDFLWRKRTVQGVSVHIGEEFFDCSDQLMGPQSELSIVDYRCYELVFGAMWVETDRTVNVRGTHLSYARLVYGSDVLYLHPRYSEQASRLDAPQSIFPSSIIVGRGNAIKYPDNLFNLAVPRGV